MLLFAVQLMQGIQYVCFALMFGGMLSLNRKDRSTLWLFCDYLLGLLGLLVALLKADLPAWLSNILGMEIPHLRYLLLHAAILCFIRSQRKTQWVGIVMAIAALPLYLLWSGTGYQDPAFATKNFALLDFVLGVQTALSAIVILRSEEVETRMPRIAMSGFLMLYSLTELTRLAIVLSTGKDPRQVAEWLEMASVTVYVMASSATPVAFIWMFNQRLLAESKQQSMIDPLTNLLNRRGLQHAFERESSRARRMGTPLALVVADIDHFKLFNDQYGHVTGDLVLCETADVFRRIMRQSDLLSRLGGEEFALVLPGVSVETATALVERLRTAVEAHTIPMNGRSVCITVSFGITSTHGRNDLTLQSLIEEADEAMYAAKQAGRNQARLHRMATDEGSLKHSPVS